MSYELVKKVLDLVKSKGHEVGGMGEYGKGWNDCRLQQTKAIEEIVREMYEEKTNKE